MALKDLTSDLSWYGKKSPGPYKPSVNKTDTRFTNVNGIPGVSITGYSDRGNSNIGFRQVVAGNEFFVDDVSLSTRGIAKRKGQGGSGFPFLKDLGWHSTDKYGDTVKRLDWKDDVAILKSGLAFSYTNNSPIDDQYNKFKFRDEAFNRTYIKQPFILRGIQRDGKTKNQRWGADKYAIDDGLVRGGILTRTHRMAIDALRLGKWLIKPKGIMWMVKQFGLQMSNPNTESGLGVVAPPFLNQKKIFTPINLLANVIGAPFGAHFQRHGILPLPTTGRYEDVVTGKGMMSLRATSALKKENNRLNKLLKELQPSAVNAQKGGGGGLFGGKLGALLTKIGGLLGFPGQGIKTLSGMTGPGSLYGIGMTNIRRAVDTSFDAQKAGKEKGFDGYGLGLSKDYWFHDAEVPYFNLPLTKENEDNELRSAAKDGLKALYGIGPLPNSTLPGLGQTLPKIGGAGVKKEPFHLSGLQAQLGTHTDNKFQDGTGDGVTKAYIDAYLTSKSEPYLGSNQEDGVIQPGTIKTLENEKDENYYQKQVKRFEDTEKGFKLTSLDAQLATQKDNKFPDGTGEGITKDAIDKYTKTKEKPYLGTDQVDGVILPGTITKSEDEKSKTKLVNRFEDTEKGFNLTGLDAQVTTDGHNTHKSFRTTDKEKEDGNQPDNPYYAHGVPTLGTATKTPHEGSTPQELEDNINPEDKVNAKSLKKTSDNLKDETFSAENTAEQNASGKNVKPVQHYAAMAYGKMASKAKSRNEGVGSSAPNDFRTDITDNNTTKNFIGKVYDTSGNETTYEKFNREKTFNDPGTGIPGRDKSNRYKNNKPDPINAAPWKTGKGTKDPNLKDFINFKFYPIEMGGKLKSAKNPIIFRAFIDSISDSISPSWQENADQGRADAKIMLDGWSRTIDLGFKVAAFSAAELQVLYNKMEALAQCAYPDYSGTAGFVGRYVKIHIGNLYKNQPCYISSLAFDWDNESPWELDEGLQVPYYTTVTLSLGWIGNLRPDAQKTKVFSVKSISADSKYKKANAYVGAGPKKFAT